MYIYQTTPYTYIYTIQLEGTVEYAESTSLEW